MYAWRLILSEQRLLNWILGPFGLKGPGSANRGLARLSYLWLPYMILPIYAGSSASRLAARGVRRPRGRGAVTFRRVILPLVLPAVVAGSIFTFSLTLGDYITPALMVSNSQFIGNVVYSNIDWATCRSPPPTRCAGP